ncbi:MAG: N-acetylneuraminate synthase family protein [Bacteroidia bacterium]|nr:N-acetylneuraminate synthase family protein [Bacteroidia bacterium]
MITEIIAEIAQGYEGDALMAELLVKGAVIANADSIKLQLVFADELCVPSYPYYDFFKSLEMNNKTWTKLVKMAHAAGKKIYFDVYGNKSILLAHKLGADGVKISTTDFFNTPLIKQAFLLFDKVFISIGGANVEDIDDIIKICTDQNKVTLMHGFQDEPTETIDNNLARIATLKSRYQNINVGFMDHSLGSSTEALQLPLVALGLRVNCIEKHITLDYSLQIEDYISALSVERFSKFVKIIRAMELSLGSSELNLSFKETEYKRRAGKVVVARHDIPEGTIIKESDIDFKRVSTIPSENFINQISLVIGKTISIPIKKNFPIEKDILK